MGEKPIFKTENGHLKAWFPANYLLKTVKVGDVFYEQKGDFSMQKIIQNEAGMQFKVMLPKAQPQERFIRFIPKTLESKMWLYVEIDEKAENMKHWMEDDPLQQEVTLTPGQVSFLKDDRSIRLFVPFKLLSATVLDDYKNEFEKQGFEIASDVSETDTRQRYVLKIRRRGDTEWDEAFFNNEGMLKKDMYLGHAFQWFMLKGNLKTNRPSCLIVNAPPERREQIKESISLYHKKQLTEEEKQKMANLMLPVKVKPNQGGKGISIGGGTLAGPPAQIDLLSGKDFILTRNDSSIKLYVPAAAFNLSKIEKYKAAFQEKGYELSATRKDTEEAVKMELKLTYLKSQLIGGCNFEIRLKDQPQNAQIVINTTWLMIQGKIYSEEADGLVIQNMPGLAVTQSSGHYSGGKTRESPALKKN